MLQFLSKKKNREEYLRNMLGAFAEENKDLVIIVADPISDYMFVGYKSKMVLGKLKSLDGAQMNVVANAVRHSVLKSQFDERMDMLVAGMVDLLKLSVAHGNQFYAFITNVLFRFQRKSDIWLASQKRKQEILANESVPAEPSAITSDQLDKIVDKNLQAVYEKH